MKARDLIILVLILVAGSAILYLVAGGGNWSVFRQSPPEPEPTEVRDPVADPGAVPAVPEDAGQTSEEAAKSGEEATEERSGENVEEGEYVFLVETLFHVDVKVVDAEGRPLASKVRIVNPAVDWYLGELPEVAKGVFRGYLPQAGRWAAEADHEGTRMRSEFELGPPTDRAQVTIRYPGSGSVSGAIYTSRGALEEDTKGEFRFLGQSDLSVELIPDAGPKGRPAALLSSLVDESGSYRIAAVPAGDYLLRIRNKFYAAEVSVGDNEHVVHDVRLGAGRIRGRVTEKGSGKPLSEVQVVLALTSVGKGVLERAGFASLSDRLSPDEDGRYEFANLPPGEYRLFANSVQHAPERGAASIGEAGRDETVDFVLELGSAVDISFLDLEGRPLSNPLWVTQGIRCGFVGTVGGLRAGTSDFIGFAPGFEVQIKKGVVFQPGEATKLEFRLAREVAAALDFHDPEGEAVEGVRVSLPIGDHDLQKLMALFLREQRLTLGITGADGRVEVRGVRPGPVRVVAKKSGFALFDAEVEIGKGATSITLEPAESTFRFRVRITGVSDGSTAAGLGLTKGDVIVSYDGKPIDTAAALSQAVAAAKARGAASVEMQVESGGATRKLTVAPGVLGVRLEEYEEE